MDDKPKNQSDKSTFMEEVISDHPGIFGLPEITQKRIELLWQSDKMREKHAYLFKKTNSEYQKRIEKSEQRTDKLFERNNLKSDIILTLMDINKELIGNMGKNKMINDKKYKLLNTLLDKLND